MHRFFVSNNNIKGSWVTFPEDVSLQISRVLRLKKGDLVVACDGNLNEYTVRLDQMIREEVGGPIIEKSINNNEPEINITLYQALLPGEKFELVLQKATELGVERIVPLETKRSLIKKNNFNTNKLERWKKIIKEAAEQSERGKIPELSSVLTFNEALNESGENITLVAYERGGERLKDALRETDGKNFSIFVGPEGGFEQSEITEASQKGARLISLGKRILRSETAGIILPGLILENLE
jgi:16S rRNA (uracil1498-N3)-methyltransferase